MQTPKQLVQTCQDQVAVLHAFYSKDVVDATRSEMEAILRRTQILCACQQQLVAALAGVQPPKDGGQ